MSFPTYVYRFIVLNVLTIFYSLFILLTILIVYLKNFFTSSLQQKPYLTPPLSLTDPKYGVHKYIIVNNIKLHYVESGDPSKPLMIFLHGYPEFWYSWRHQIVHFNMDYWCIALDLRGFGDSEKPKGTASYKADLVAKDVRELVKQLGREKCILVSHDWGGFIASRFRDVYPEALLAVVVLASCSLEAMHYEIWNNPKQRSKSWYMFLFQAPLIPEYFMEMHRGTAFKQIMLIKGKDTVTENDIECFEYCYGKQSAFTPPTNYYRANLKCFVPERPACERNIPFLAAHAANDVHLCHSLLETMKRQYKHIETTIVENCGHFLQQEEPDKVNQLVEEFLKKHNIKQTVD